MFTKQTFIDRRNALRRLMLAKGTRGNVILFGNNHVPYNCAKNPYPYFRQDSSFRYFFGANNPGLIGVIELDGDKDTLIGNDPTGEDFIWMGTKPSLAEVAAEFGITSVLTTVDPSKINDLYSDVHYLPAYRDDIKNLQGVFFQSPSVPLIQSIVELRSIKSAEEIAHLDEIHKVGYDMHIAARALANKGVPERNIVAEMKKIIIQNGGHESFPMIVSINGHILHNETHNNVLQNGELLLVDAGFESSDGYCTDHTRTWAVSGSYTSMQQEIYKIVLAAKKSVENGARPGMPYKTLHMVACLNIAQGLIELGLMKGKADDIMVEGAHALFMPHGVGHMMGMDCHDMEPLGEDFVGYGSSVLRSNQFGLAWLRMARPLQEGFVVTNEPGIYFNPYLIDNWRAKKKFLDFINYEALEKYKNFGGIRLEDDLLITKDGCRFLGNKQIPL